MLNEIVDSLSNIIRIFNFSMVSDRFYYKLEVYSPIELV